MKVELRYFASLREALGNAETVEVTPGTTVRALRASLVKRGGRHAEVLAVERVVRAARNRRLCGDDEVVEEGDEVAFFPPVTGG